MRTFYAETVLQQDGRLILERLPFARGEAVQVYLAAHEHSGADSFSLRGTVVRYEKPFEPVAEDDWAAAQ